MANNAAVPGSAVINTLISVLTNGHAGQLLPALLALVLTFSAIWLLQGRFWAILYVALIPFLNWSFGVIPEYQVIAPHAGTLFSHGMSLHPMTMVTGMVFVVRDFVQREMHHRVLIVMLLAVGWSFYYAWPVIALASGIAFAVSEGVDWLLFTFTKYRLSTRILMSSALAAPVDTTVFLYGADLAKQIEFGAEPGNSLHMWNWIVFVIGKMVGAVIVSAIIRRREDLGLTNPAEL
jgi:uncharacterized PurR-regulated membrane protein YhhQ (DUF165 family)